MKLGRSVLQRLGTHMCPYQQVIKCWRDFHPTFDFQNVSRQPWALQPNISVFTNTDHPCLLFAHCYQTGAYLFEDNWTCRKYYVELIK